MERRRYMAVEYGSTALERAGGRAAIYGYPGGGVAGTGAQGARRREGCIQEDGDAVAAKVKGLDPRLISPMHPTTHRRQVHLYFIFNLCFLLIPEDRVFMKWLKYSICWAARWGV